MSSPTTAQAAPELPRAPSGRVRDAMEVTTVLALMYGVRLLTHRLGLTFGVGAVSIVAGLALATWLLARGARAGAPSAGGDHPASGPPPPGRSARSSS